MKRTAILATLLLCVAICVCAQAIDPLPFRDAAQRERFQQLTAQLRCLVCQNENLADSNADLARDLRHQIFKMMQAGKSDGQIKQYLVARYSDFVLYDPPLKPGTWMLWFGPLLVLGLGGVVLIVQIRRRATRAATAPGPEEDW